MMKPSVLRTWRRYENPRLIATPKGFRRIREAYEALQDHERRLALRLFGPPPLANFEELLDAVA